MIQESLQLYLGLFRAWWHQGNFFLFNIGEILNQLLSQGGVQESSLALFRVNSRVWWLHEEYSSRVVLINVSLALNEGIYTELLSEGFVEGFEDGIPRSNLLTKE